MAIEFYNVKKKKVSIEDTEIKKVEYKKTTKGVQVRYAFRAQDDDGLTLRLLVKQITIKLTHLSLLN